MANLRPYIAIDIETTGLDVEKSQILQLGWVIDDGISPWEHLQKGSIFIQNPQINYGENYALGMNAWIFQELMKPATERIYPTATPQEGLEQLFVAIEETGHLAKKFDELNGVKRPSNRVQIAGKNAGNFDWPIILNNSSFSRLSNMDFSDWKRKYVDHRFIDCGAIFFSDFGKNPGFDEINKLIGWKDINHDALDDAINVVVALRFKVGLVPQIQVK